MADPPHAAGAPRIRLLALDVDGTLLTSQHRVTDAVAAAVRHAADAGIRVVLTTARPPRGLLPVLAALADPDRERSVLEAFIASQGALTGRYLPGGVLTILAREPMVAADALAFVRSLPPGVSVSWFSGERWLVERLDPLVEQEASIVGFRPEVVDLSGEVEGPDKLLLLAPDDDPARLDGLAVAGGLAAVRSTPTHLEVTRAGVDKAVALVRLCARLGVDPGEVAAMGDGRNDIPMLALAGVSLAPRNAPEEVRRVADFVTASNDHDGVVEAVHRLLGG